MPSKVPLSAPKFGRWLQLQRGQRSLEQIAQKVRVLVRPTGLKVSSSLIYKIEQGRVPSWPMLAALSRVYNVPIVEATAVLVASLNFPGARDLIGPSNDIQLASKLRAQEGGADDDVSPVAISALAEELRAVTHAFVGVIPDVADRLMGGMETSPDTHTDATFGGHPPRRVPPDRKAG